MHVSISYFQSEISLKTSLSILSLNSTFRIWPYLPYLFQVTLLPVSGSQHWFLEHWGFTTPVTTECGKGKYKSNVLASSYLRNLLIRSWFSKLGLSKTETIREEPIPVEVSSESVRQGLTKPKLPLYKPGFSARRGGMPSPLGDDADTAMCFHFIPVPRKKQNYLIPKRLCLLYLITPNTSNINKWTFIWWVDTQMCISPSAHPEDRNQTKQLS